jgi:hypothetical protein
MLRAQSHDVPAYKVMHKSLHNAVEEFTNDLLLTDYDGYLLSRRRLHFNTEYDAQIPIAGVHDAGILMSPLPYRFRRDGVTAGTIIIDTFKRENRSVCQPFPLLRDTFISTQRTY